MAQQEKGPRLFTVEEANRLIPQVQQILRKLQMIQEQIKRSEEEKAIEELSWLREDGTVSPRAKIQIARLEKLLEARAKEFEQDLERLNKLGGQLKSLEEGLVDFLGEREGQLICLCWKDGEDQIRFWHDMESGVAGRQPL
ncbi:MAG: DUF2203 domain-containing protein [Candidatus Omnitrophica bacterium]|nr:DUF2203 domain-containing protein [Candidatus Omnitrophota bacterium]